MKHIGFILSFLLVTVLHAQKMTVEKTIATEKKVLSLASRYNDITAYKSALFRLIALEGEQSGYKDTLAELYFRTGEFVSLLPLTKELLTKNPDNKRYLSMQVAAYEQLGDLKNAIETLEKLHALLPGDVRVGYQLAWDQYLLKRIDEAYATLIKMKDQQFPEDAVVAFPVGKKAERVPLKAAYYNLLGLVTYDLHNLDLALQYFDKALKVYPDFAGAKQNKAAVELMKKKLNAADNQSQGQKSHKKAQ